MLIVRKRWGRARRFGVMFKVGEFSPTTTQQERGVLFGDFRRWGVSLISLAGALGVHEDRVRGWKNRPQYRIPDRYWYQLVHAHKTIFQHLLENGCIDAEGNVNPKWLPNRKSNAKVEK